MKKEYRLCYVDGQKTWFTDSFENNGEMIGTISLMNVMLENLMIIGQSKYQINHQFIKNNINLIK